MKEPKPLTTGPSEREGPVGPTQDNGAQRGMGRPQVVGSVEQGPLRPRPMMQTDMQTRKRRGRLGRDVQTKLGKTLQAYFDDVVKEGVPDRFKELLQQYDERKDKGSS
jgi:anti-sigma factor NepR-like protein